MSKLIKDIKIPYPTEGVIRSAQLDDTVTPQNSVQLAVNMNFDRIGAMTSRAGLETFTESLSGSISSFGTLNIQSSGLKRLFAQVGNDVSVWDGTSWTLVRTTTVSDKARYSQWLDHLYMVNGTDELECSDGGAFSAIPNFIPATTMPVGEFVQAGFDGRIWIANAANDAIYYSDIVQFTPPSTFSITYDSSNFISKFSSQNGESITGLWRVPRALLIFKQNHIYRVYNTENVDPYPAYNVGTYSQESIIETKNGLYFHHSSGFYKFAYNGQPIEISRRIIDFVKAIPRSYYENVKGIWDGHDAVEWHVGQITVDGVVFKSCVMRYSISTQIWTIYDYPDNYFTAMIRYDDGSDLNMIAGTSNGAILKMDIGILDITSPINYEIIDRWRSFTEMYANSKSVSGINILSENAGGTILEYQTEKSTINKWEYIDTINNKYNALFPNASTDDFNIIRFRLKGISKGTPIIIHGIEILSLQNKGLDEN